MIGLFAFYAGAFASMVADDCLKDCSFAIWPIVLAICAPLIYVAVKDVILASRGAAGMRVFSLAWWAKRSIPIGMALSTLHINRTVSNVLVKLINSIPVSS